MKTFKSILFASMLIATATATANAQLFSANLPANAEKSDVVSSAVESNKSSSSKMMMANKAGYKAVKNFTSRFEDAADVTWTTEPEVISANFTRDGIKNHIIYSKKGSWIRNMKIYQEEKLPKDVRQLVKRSRYFDYNIKQVQEFLEGDILFYVVHLEDDKTCKQITVHEGEINLLSSFEKQL